MTRRLDVLVCSGAACVSLHSAKVREALSHEIAKRDLAEEVRIVETGCMGPCELGPVLLVYPDGSFYTHVNPEDAAEIVEEHFLKGRPVKRLLWEAPEARRIVEDKKQIPFFAGQKKVVLANCGRIDPENIEEYIAADGYEALGKVLTEMNPGQVVATITDSGLRGRGGAGFPTGKKWQFVAGAKGSPKYIVCNGDEGDPGAFMDRSLLEGDPHTVIEGMMIGAYAVGASRGYMYIRAEYPLAIKRLQLALDAARDAGLLGEDILETGFSFDIEVRMGAGAFVCGEETALIASLEGERGIPRVRPPYPAVRGLFGKPTLINNVETWGNIRHIILNGADWFSSIGTKESPGTKVFALSGKVMNTGLVEVPMGTTLRELVFDIGGGIPNGKAFKAVQTGGPSGGCIPEEHLDTPINYESLQKLGAIMGSGGVIVMDEENCMVNIAKFFIEFTSEESCGQCVPCRAGLPRMQEILERITSGNGSQQDLDLLKDLSETIIETSFCGLGKSAPNPVLSTMKYFAEEYREHIEEKKCRAKECIDLISYWIDEEACKACDRCRRDCPVEAISGEPGKPPYRIDEEICMRCGTCVEVCPFGAVHVLTGEQALKSDRKEGL
ncbi:MAG: NADH-quinone oxidoreductase subunit NuoF [Candidatus Bipolaricaulota bacterium]|nr:NADH-quinone oxidoreductase subunit NuoF [Candidatus Bipolaricaulota bacterium]